MENIMEEKNKNSKRFRITGPVLMVLFLAALVVVLILLKKILK